MEAGLGIAKVMAETGEERRAFDKLSDILRRKPQWRFFRTDEVSPGALIEDFVRLFNQLRSTLVYATRRCCKRRLWRAAQKSGETSTAPAEAGRNTSGGVQASMAP